MSGFTAEWLRLREPADAAARAADLVPAIGGQDDRALRIVDLAAGTGSNLRWLAPRLGKRQDWLAVDHDPLLLDALARGPRPEGVRVEALHLDLATQLDRVPLAGADLVTASALLDLVSGEWLERLVDACAATRAAVLFALTYDGRIEWQPAEQGDEAVRMLLNRHQLRDKGFGPALGPGAATAAVEALQARGYVVRSARSDWVLGPADAALQRALVDGWVEACAGIAPDARAAIDEWALRRRDCIARGESRLRVGHVDIAGELPDQGTR